jgi:hypothetical protein
MCLHKAVPPPDSVEESSAGRGQEGRGTTASRLLPELRTPASPRMVRFSGWTTAAGHATCMRVKAVIAAGTTEVVAVVIGGLLTAGFTVFIEWQRRRRETRVARRLLSVELEDAVRTLATVVKDLRDDKEWPYETKDWAQSWTGQRQALAMGRLDDKELRKFGAAFGALGQLQGSLATGRRNFVADDPNFLQTVERALTELGGAFPDDYDRLTDEEVAQLRARIEARRPVKERQHGP